MEKQKQMAQPKETPEQRPELYYTGVACRYESRHNDGVVIQKSGFRVVIKIATYDPFPEVSAPWFPNPVGTKFSGQSRHPKYTGPIDDEMMANILIYG